MTAADGTSENHAQGVVEIVGPDLDRSLAFYTSLGFAIERRTGPFAVMSGYGVRLFLAENRDAPSGPRWTNLRILVPDADALRDKVCSLGVPLVHEIDDRFYGLRDFVVADPSGFEIRFAHVIAPSTC